MLMTGDESGRIAGVVLAAGTSSRMGQNKLLLPIGGVSMLRRAVAAAGDGGLDPVLVVLGHQSERALEELAGISCTPILNTEYARGMNSSVRAGISAVRPDASGAVLMLADMPFVSAGMVRRLVDRYRATRAKLVVSIYGEVLAPPIFYRRDLFSELGDTLDGDGCGKRVMKRHRSDAVEICWPYSLLTDLDLQEDLERVRAQLDSGHAGASITA
jgi:molybdenum cofactor cytidylyltransferase